MSAQPTKPASPIGLLFEELPNVYVFSVHKMFATFCASFPNISFQDPGYALPLCTLFTADTNPREPCVSRSLEVGITFLILSYSKAKGQNVCRVVRFDTVTLFCFDFPLNVLSPRWLRIM